MEIRRTVLVVDDESNIRASLCDLLSSDGYLPTPAATGKEALALLATQYFDAILLDVELPDISGHEVLVTLRSISVNSNPTVILITGLKAVNDTLRMVHSGVSDYVIKGKHFYETLLAKLQQHLGESPLQPPERLRRLAHLMIERHRTHVPPFLLVLGAGASLSSGCSSFSKIIEDLLVRIGGVLPKQLYSFSDEERDRRFDDIFAEMGENDRRAFLEEHLSHGTISAGYVALARMLQKGYFRHVVTTNLDNVLEHQLGLDGFINYRVLVVGRDKEDHIHKVFQSDNQLAILKLHGDVQSGCYAFTRSEIFQFNDEVENVLTELLKRDIVIVGHGMRDIDLVRCLQRDGGKIWCVDPARPRHPLATAMDCRKSTNAYVDDMYGRFDNFFAAVEHYIHEGCRS